MWAWPAWTVALHVAEHLPVVVLAKRPFEEGATAWAQGGIVGVLGDDDSIASHVSDTSRRAPGSSTSTPRASLPEHSARRGMAARLRRLPFTADPRDRSACTSRAKAAHGAAHRHAADATGKAIHDALLGARGAHPNIALRERWMAVDVITSRHLGRDESPRCYGVYALDIDRQRVETLPAAGGRARHRRRRQGLPIHQQSGHRDRRRLRDAWRAGCRVGNMEFIQFHPTCLYRAPPGAAAS